MPRRPGRCTTAHPDLTLLPPAVRPASALPVAPGQRRGCMRRRVKQPARGQEGLSTLFSAASWVSRCQNGSTLAQVTRPEVGA